MTVFRQQFKILLWKNYLLKRRNAKQFSRELLIPIFFVLILAMMKGMLTLYPLPAIDFLPEYSLENTSAQVDFSRKILVSPNSSYARRIADDSVKIVAEILRLTYKPSVVFLRDKDEMLRSYRTDENVTVGIIFQYSAGNELSYAIRMSPSDIASPLLPYVDKERASDIQNCRMALNRSNYRILTEGQCRDGDGLDSTDCMANTYLHSGFCVLQTAIDTALIRERMKDNTIQPAKISVQMLPKSKFLPNTTAIQVLSAIFIVVGFCQILCFICINIVTEKESKIKDAMKVMGMTEFAFWSSWGVVYILLITIVTSVTTAVAILSNLFIQSNMFIFFMILFIYGISEIAIAFAISPFFSKAQEAGGVTSLGSVIISLLYLIVSLTRTVNSMGEITSTISPVGRCFLSLFSPAAFALAIDQAIFLEITGGMTFDTMTKGDLPLYALMLMMILDSALYIIVTICLKKYFKGLVKTCQSFPPISRLGNILRGRSNSGNNANSKSIEDEPLVCSAVEEIKSDDSLKTVIRFSNITKMYDSNGEEVKALNDFSLSIYEDQITCLLGHNSAGKTTLIKMISGMEEPTSGTIAVFGYDISNSANRKKVRPMIGMCPQHDILFDDLTCAEHIKLYAGLKGVREETVPEKILQSLKEVGLERQQHQRAKSLSGGQRRKLSVAIALIGDPTILIMDEPTAGMDPCSRRHIWKLLKAKKQERTIILSTHFMDEADILADRKAIISKGSLKCCGSSLFLKNQFEIGYHLNMLIAADCNVGDVTKLIRQYVPGVQFQRSHAKELVYTLPIAGTEQFPALFGALEAKTHDNAKASDVLGIISYGVSMTTLEEVFLKLKEKEASADFDVLQKKQPHGNPQENEEVNVNLHNENSTHESEDYLPFLPDQVRVDIKSLKMRQFLTLCKIRMLRTIRSKKFFTFVYLFVPVLLVIAGILISKHMSDPLLADPLAVNLTNMIGYYARINGSSSSDRIPPLLVRDSADSFLSNIWTEEVQNHYVTETYTNASDLIKDDSHFVGIDLHAFEMAGFNAEVDYSILYNTEAVHALPAMINFLSNSVLRTETLIDDTNSTFIHAFNLPWPTDIPQFHDVHMGSNLILASAFLMMAPAFAVELVKDRQRKCRTQLKVAGVPSEVYWASNFVIDVLKQYIPAVLTVVMSIALQVDSLRNTGALLSLILTLITYIPASTAFVYVLSFSFSSFESCQSVLPSSYLSMGLLPFLAVALQDMFTSTSIATVLHCIICIIDTPYTIFGSIYYINRVYRMKGANVPVEDYFHFESNITMTFVMPVVQTLFYFIILRYLDKRQTGNNDKTLLSCLKSKKSEKTDLLVDAETQEQEESDVSIERQRVSLLKNEISSKYPIALVENLRKEFPQQRKSPCFSCFRRGKSKDRCTIAVDNLTFAVDSGEVFGLLGPNGAGKSTTISMMISVLRPTLGDAFVGGCDIRSSLSDAFQIIGYCPQHDALWEGITLKEHLEYYAAIRGLTGKDVGKAADWYIEQLGLAEYKDRFAQNLSGGTKRKRYTIDPGYIETKLSYAISMMGQPKVVLLDEPSTGLDPSSKRLLWNTISGSFKGSDKGAILTTHSMEEADALCSRIGIMVNGKFECLGVSQQLKNKYGSGYFLEIKSLENVHDVINKGNETLHQYITSIFPAATLLEKFDTRAHYRIPRENCGSLAQIFSALEEGKSRHSFEEYSFSQSTLEQVFLEFAKKQYTEETEDYSFDSDDVLHDRETIL